MTDAMPNPLSHQTAEEVFIERQEILKSQICDLEARERAANQHYRSILTKCLVFRSQVSYLRFAGFLRKTIAPFLGWRWPVVVIGTTLVGGIFLALSSSWLAGLLGLIVGAALFAGLMNYPSDANLPDAVAASTAKNDDMEVQRKAARDTLTQLSQAVKTAKGDQARLVKELEQFRQSSLRRRQQLVSRHWKAMRGEELELFLQEVFSELQYHVTRTGGTGDQGVDLVLRKAGNTIAVQVKGYMDRVPNTAIQEAHTGMTFHECDACAVVTNSRFTQSGRNLAKAVGCVLIDEFQMPSLIVGQIDLWREVCKLQSQRSAEAAR